MPTSGRSSAAQPIVDRFEGMGDIPAETAESKRDEQGPEGHGFRFVGPTVCYAFMQAAAWSTTTWSRASGGRSWPGRTPPRLGCVHGIAQMRDTHTGDDCRIPEDDRCVREVVEQPHSCA